MIPTLDQVNVLHRAGRLEEAERGYHDILADAPAVQEAHHGFGVLLLQTGRAIEAVSHLKKALDGDPDNDEILNALGAAQLQVGDTAAAALSFRTILERQPGHAKASANLGVAYYRLNDLSAAVEALTQAARIDPSNADTFYNLSQAYRAFGQLNEAERAIRKALKLLPTHVEANIDFGITLAAQGKHSEAEASYRKALLIDPHNAEAHHNLAQIFLQSGRLSEGWKAFEWRWQTEDFRGVDTFQDLPAWKGQKMSRGTLLVWTEQGLGDQILYSSMVSELAGIAPRILIACSARLVPLFTRSFPFADVTSQAEVSTDEVARAKVKAQVPIGSLGQFYLPNMHLFSKRKSFLKIDFQQSSLIRKRYLEQTPCKPLIGVSWRSGNPRFGASKTISLPDLASILCDIDATFIDLQYGETETDRERAAQHGLHIRRDPDIDSLVDLDAFAAQVAAMDLVITVSNTTAHVAGALGVPCWTLVSAGTGQFWYWFLDRDDSPWYPSMRLFRQAAPGDWSGVLSELKSELSQWIRGTASHTAKTD